MAPWLKVSFTVLDILLVALVIYEVLVMIRGTRAAPMLAGLAAVAVAFYLARIGELVTLNWLVSHLLPYIVFALIVVFQSEIRHVLSDVGRRVSFLRGSSVEADSYDDIVLAANLFSQHQTGALIVIEREIGLRTYVESGVPMDARLSYDLLATIFRPSAPLHDGAVIIQKDRLGGGGMFSAALDESRALDADGYTASCCYRNYGRDRCDCGRSVGGDPAPSVWPWGERLSAIFRPSDCASA